MRKRLITMMQQITRKQFDEVASMSRLLDYPNVFTVDVLSRQGFVLVRRVDTQNGRDNDMYFASDEGLEILKHL